MDTNQSPNKRQPKDKDIRYHDPSATPENRINRYRDANTLLRVLPNRSLRQDVETNIQQQAEKINNDLTNLEKRVTGNITGLEKKMMHKVDKIDDQLRSDKLQSIQILALFVAFFTFVSVEFQLFSQVKDTYTYFALSVVLLSSLLIFVCLTFSGIEYTRSNAKNIKDAFARTKISNSIAVGIFAMILLIVGVVIGAKSAQDDHVYEHEQLVKCQRLSQEVETAINRDYKTAAFLKERYSNECKQTVSNGE